jgi:HEAT repeat protein
MKGHRRESSKEHGFQDELPEGAWSPQRQRFAEQVGLLVKALRSTEEGVQELAVVQVTLLGPKAVPYLASALEAALDECDRRQSAHRPASGAEREIAGICRALGIIRDADAVVDLAVALPRREAVEALSRIGGERALNLLTDTIEGWCSLPLGVADADPEFVRRARGAFERSSSAGRLRGARRWGR